MFAKINALKVAVYDYDNPYIHIILFAISTNMYITEQYLSNLYILYSHSKSHIIAYILLHLSTTQQKPQDLNFYFYII